MVRRHVRLPKSILKKLRMAAGFRDATEHFCFCLAAGEWLLLHRSSRKHDSAPPRPWLPPTLTEVCLEELGPVVGPNAPKKPERFVALLEDESVAALERVRQHWLDSSDGDDPSYDRLHLHLNKLARPGVAETNKGVSLPTIEMRDKLGETQTKQFTIPKHRTAIHSQMVIEAAERGKKEHELYEEALAWWLLYNFSMPSEKVNGHFLPGFTRTIALMAQEILSLTKPELRRVLEVRLAFSLEHPGRPFSCVAYMLNKCPPLAGVQMPDAKDAEFDTPGATGTA